MSAERSPGQHRYVALNGRCRFDPGQPAIPRLLWCNGSVARVSCPRPWIGAEDYEFSRACSNRAGGAISLAVDLPPGLRSLAATSDSSGRGHADEAFLGGAPSRYDGGSGSRPGVGSIRRSNQDSKIRNPNFGNSWDGRSRKVRLGASSGIRRAIPPKFPPADPAAGFLNRRVTVRLGPGTPMDGWQSG